MAAGQLIIILVLFLLHVSVFMAAYMVFKRNQAPLRITIILAACSALSLLGWRWNGLWGALLLPAVTLTLFVISLVLVSQSLFPVSDWEKRWGAVLTLLSYILDFNLPSYVIENGKAELRVPGRTMSHRGIGVIRVGVANAAVMQTTTQFSRVIGPGVSFSKRMESVKAVVDLHTQSRFTASAKAQTKDGVPIEASLFCLFRIAPDEAPGSRRDDFRYPEENIRQVIYHQAGLAEEDESFSWDQFALQTVVACFKEIIDHYSLDELFAPHDPDLVPRQEVVTRLNEEARRKLKRQNIELLFAGFGTLKLPPSITQQRIESWRTRWVAQAMEMEAASETDAERLRQEARAAGQWDLVQSMVNSLSAAQSLSGIESADLITWQLLHAMETMSADPMLRPLVPQETVNALLSIREWLEAPEHP
jgi:regulator of protease activity HflC (stomatin/prohibitin superfamily)